MDTMNRIYMMDGYNNVMIQWIQCDGWKQWIQCDQQPQASASMTSCCDGLQPEIVSQNKYPSNCFFQDILSQQQEK